MLFHKKGSLNDFFDDGEPKSPYPPLASMRHLDYSHPMSEPQCPKCHAEYTYADGALWVCPQCSHEWSQTEAAPETKAALDDDPTIRDANGNALADGDSVTIIKDLKVKGASGSLKVGTKVKSIRLIPDASDGHNISCKIDGFGAMNLKSEFVRKN